MSDDMDWEDIGLKCGLEIHQQLDGEKLFCNCPGIIRDDSPDFELKRYLRASAGETGKRDVAAVAESQKDKHFIYQGYKDSNCLVELDESPPYPMDEDALETTIQVSKLVSSEVVDEVHVMRKTIVDGSNTSAFQRTALISRGGILKTSEGSVGVETICLEEDSCRIIDSDEDKTVFRLDRLGIPLIEIATAPDIKSPEHCLETAKKIGSLLRSTGDVKRGLGTIRQDVNVSISEGSRVEIKGAQELELLPELVRNEVRRQRDLLDIKDELVERGVDQVQVGFEDVSEAFEDTESGLIEDILSNDGVVLGMKLEGFDGLLGREIQPGRTFGAEMSDRAKVLAGVGGILHSDELPDYGISEGELEKVEDILGSEEDDCTVLISGMREECERAVEVVADRAGEAIEEVPAEVRDARDDGTTSYLRPLSGAARMYPETDIPVIRPDPSEVEVPETIDEKISRYTESYGLSDDLARLIARSKRGEVFDEVVEEYDVKASFVAEAITGGMKELSKEFDFDPDSISDDDIFDVFGWLDEGRISKDSVPDIFVDIAGDEFDIEDYEMMDDDEIEEKVEEIVEENPDAPFGALMGMATEELGDKASGEKISEVLKELT